MRIVRHGLWVVLLAALALPACGEDSGSAAASATLDRKGLRAIKRLTPKQYRAIERIYVENVRVEALDPAKMDTAAELDAALRPTLKVCDALDTSNPLIAAVHVGCPPLAAFTRAAVSLLGCEEGACGEAAGHLASAVSELIAAGRHADRATRLTRLPRKCKRALITPASAYEIYDDMREASIGLARAFDDGSDEEILAAAMVFDAVDEDSLPKATVLLRRYRAGCR